MKYSMLILFLIFESFFVNAQTRILHVEYEYSNGTRSELGNLFVKNDSVTFIIDNYYHKNDNESIEHDETSNIIKIQQKEVNINTRKFYNKLGEETYYLHLLEEELLVIDNVPRVEWEIESSDTKKFGSLEGIKAKGRFRGSDVICYFTSEVPVSTGPWKFSGLPGLILEVSTMDNSNRWTIKNIDLDYVGETPDFSPPKGNVISKRNMVEKNDEKISLILDKIKSRSPEGTKISDMSMRREGFEKVFEWEQ